MRWAYQLSAITQKQTGLQGWLIAFAVFLAAFAFRWMLRGVLAGLPFLTFFPAIIIAAAIAGWRPAAGVLVLSTLAAWYFWLPPFSSFAVTGPETPISLLLFVIVGSLNIALIEAFRQLPRLNAAQEKRNASQQERLTGLVRQQETMFREMQHRVANNMQFIASMIADSRRRIHRGEEAEPILDQAVARISSMAKLHRKLHDLGAYSRGMQPVLEEVLAELFADLPVVVRVHVTTTGLTMDQTATAVLLVTEAATNAIKHVFRAEQGSLFEVDLRDQADGQTLFVIRDDGPGIPLDVDEAPRTLGMNIMHSLAQQLGGELRFSNEGGTTIAVEFPSA